MTTGSGMKFYKDGELRHELKAEGTFATDSNTPRPNLGEAVKEIQRSDRELMQMALDALNDSEASDARYEAIKALRDRLAQPEPEPVGYWNAVEGWVELPEIEDEQEPFCWVYSEGVEALKAGKCWTAYGTKQDDDCKFPLYTAPPKRGWIDLTPEEIGELTVFDGLNHIETDILADFVWKVGEKIKEKNV